MINDKFQLENILVKLEYKNEMMIMANRLAAAYCLSLNNTR